MRSRTLDRYIFGEMLPPFFLSMAVLTLVLFLQKLFRLADLVSKGASVLSTVKVLAFIVPGFLVITIPMSQNPVHQRENLETADIRLTEPELAQLA